MQFKLTFAIQPSGPFGVPQEATTVVPGRAGTINGPTLESASGAIVGYGTLSEYRAPEKAIHLALPMGDSSIEIHDNFGSIGVQANSPGDAYKAATKTLDKLLQHLTLSNGNLFSYQPLTFESEDGRLYPVPRYLQLMRVVAYNLEQLASEIQKAARLSSFEDEKLTKAMEYYEQALLLFQNRSQLADVLSRHHALLIAAAFLNLWKAVSVIVGDPNVDKDYQSRYRTLGFDYEYFRQKIEKVRELRNDYDVAHYSLDSGDIERVEANFGEATQITRDVLQRYRAQIA